MNRFSLILFFMLGFGLLENAVADINSGLVAYYKFDGNANDSSDNGNHLTQYGDVTFTNGIVGQSATFDGTNDYFRAEVSSDFSLSNFTLATWVNVQGNGNTVPRIIAIGPPGGSAQYYAMAWNGINKFLFFDGISSDYAYSNGLYSADGIWRHVSMVYNASTKKIRIFINGKLDSEQTVSGNLKQFSSAILQIGISDNLLDDFHGSIDDLRIYDRTLSEAEIQEIYTDETSCSTTGYTQADIDNTIEQGKQICINSPSSCGIKTESGLVEAGTVSENLDIYMPSLNYATLFGIQNIWVDFQYYGKGSNDELLWRLKDYGANN